MEALYPKLPPPEDSDLQGLGLGGSCLQGFRSRGQCAGLGIFLRKPDTLSPTVDDI